MDPLEEDCCGTGKIAEVLTISGFVKAWNVCRRHVHSRCCDDGYVDLHSSAICRDQYSDYDRYMMFVG